MSKEKTAAVEGPTCAHDDPTQPERCFPVTITLRASTLEKVEALRAQGRAVEVSTEALLRALIVTGLAHWTPAPSD